MKRINLTETKMEFKEYVKIVTTKAVQIDEPFVVDTLEGTFEGKAGDWLAEDTEGKRHIIDDAIFRKTYIEVDHAR